ncbi:MAG: ABC transporter ATP-binding protein [Ignavibacteriales bacterium]
MLQVEGLCKRFGGLAAISDVGFRVNQGQVLGLIGPNGAGKTTLFNLLSGALVPDSGTIRLRRRVINGFKPHQIRRLGVARTFQNAKPFPNMTVLQNALVGAIFGTPSPVTRGEADRNARKAIKFVGLSDVMHKPAGSINLVSQKRLEVARALAARPELLLLDEMMAGLNLTEVEESMALVKSIRDTGITVVMIEHVMKAIMSICDTIIVLHHGKKIAEGTPEEIASNKTVIEVYLGER